jgi:hypothetical protein
MQRCVLLQQPLVIAISLYTRSIRPEAVIRVQDSPVVEHLNGAVVGPHARVTAVSHAGKRVLESTHLP